MPLGIFAVLAIEKGIWWEEGRSCTNFEEKERGLCSTIIAQIWQIFQGHKRKGKMGLVTIIPYVETISFTSWTLVPLGARWRRVTDHHVKNG